MTAARVQYVNAPDGVAHTADTVKRMAQLARDGSHTYAIRSLATKITHHVPGKDTRGELAAIYQWVRDNIRYRYDPRGLEWIQAPDRTVQEKAGDCDDLAILIAALVQAIGHRTRYRTVGKTDKRQSHVHAQAWDGSAWVDMDPVLEPRQATTAPRADLGAFGYQAPGAQRLYNQQGQPMAGLRTVKKQPAAIQLWQPTAWERHRLGTPRIERVYASRGQPKIDPIRYLWVNQFDHSDLAGLGHAMGFSFKSIGKIASSAMKVVGTVYPPAAAAGAALDIGMKVAGGIGGKKKKAPAGVPPGTVIRDAQPPAAARAVTPSHVNDPYRPAPCPAPINVAPIVTAGLQASREAQQLLAAQSKIAIDALAGRRNSTSSRRQKWDPVARRWTVYEAANLGKFSPSVSFSLLGAMPDFDRDARKAAVLLADSVRRKGRNYDRTLAVSFQMSAGLTRPDGITYDGLYGGRTAGAVRYFTGKAPPPAIFKPTREVPYTPRTRPAPLATAPSSPPFVAVPPTPARVAVPVSNTINLTPQALTRHQMAAALVVAVSEITRRTGKPPRTQVPGAIGYQTAAGIKVDGLWGPQTRAAAAADLRVDPTTLPASAFDARRPRAPRTPRTPRGAATPAYVPTHTTPNDEGHPVIGPPPAPTPAPTPAVEAATDDNTKWLILGGIYYLSKRNKQRQTNGRRRR